MSQSPLREIPILHVPHYASNLCEYLCLGNFCTIYIKTSISCSQDGGHPAKISQFRQWLFAYPTHTSRSPIIFSDKSSNSLSKLGSISLKARQQQTIPHVSQAMALQWSDPVNTTPKPKRPLPVIPPPDFSKHDLVFVLGMTDSDPNNSFNLCEVIDFGYRLQQREYIYFCKTIDHLFAIDTIVLCNDKYLRKPKYRAGTRLRVRDLDDRVNGVGIISDWKVSIECLEFVHGKFVYWIKVPGAGKKNGSLLLDVDESKLEKMATAAAKRRKMTA
jgi:hypothetical protein